jgi:lipoate-protein ligase A
LKIRDYKLSDFDIFAEDKGPFYKVWIPDKLYIVLGKSNQLEDSVWIESALHDHIEILKRPSGGEAVIISPDMAVISYRFQVGKTIKIHDYFKVINTKIISALAEAGVRNLGMNGISDISIGERKILGSSMLKKGDMGFYHAVLNVAGSVESISRYLKHPKREPGYRKGRAHEHFVTSLSEEGYRFKPKEIVDIIEKKFREF